MELRQLQAQQRLIIRQRVRLMANQYEVRAAQPDGSEGDLLAFAQQKRQVTPGIPAIQGREEWRYSGRRCWSGPTWH